MNDCSCVYVMDYDPPQLYNEKLAKAKEEHSCCECGKKIQPEDQYVYISGKWEGRFNVFKMCVVCKEIIDAFFCDGFLFEVVLDNLWEHIADMQGHIDSSCLASLSSEAREVVCDMIERYWEEMDEDEEQPQ